MHPAIEARVSGLFRVSPLHTIYWEESGNPEGIPAVFVHGGPGGGTEPSHRRFFDPAIYRIILFDQRGCGKSTPHAELRENTTWDLVADMERLREMLEIDRWLVFGGSWGSTLALAYAQAHPTRTLALVLRGIFLVRKIEIDWFYEGGCSWIFPDAWADFVAPIPTAERGNFVAAYYRRLTSPDRSVRLEAARAWSTWEARTSRLIVSDQLVDRHGEDDFAEAFSRIECHYFQHGCWFNSDDQLLKNVDKIRKIPGAIVQGRYDVVCPMRSAWDLHQVWPESELHVVADAGHSAFETGIAQKLVEVTDRFGRQLSGK